MSQKSQKSQTLLRKYLRGLLALPLILLVTIPLLILRLIAILTAKLRPSLGRPLSPISCLFAVDEMYKRPSCTLVLMGKLDRRVDLNTLRKYTQGVIDSGRYPELTQKLGRWLGFYFWEKVGDGEFSLDNHLSVLKDKPMDEEEVNRQREILVRKPFVEGRPLWEFVIFPNYKETGNSIFAMRVHHSLADGYSILNLINALSESESKPAFEKIPSRKYANSSFLQKGAFFMKFLFTGPAELLQEISNCQDVNDWKVPPEKVTGNYEKFQTDILELDVAKRIAKSRNVRLSAVIFAAFSGAMRNLKLKLGQKLPNDLTVICPMPLPNHPEGLTNYMTLMPIKAPLTTEDPLERLRKVSADFDSMPTSILPSCFAALMSLSGLITSLTMKGKSSTLGTVIMTNFPGPAEPVKLLGAVCNDFSFGTGLQRKGLAFGFSSMSYNGRLILAAKADTSLFPDKETTKEFIQLVIKEFEVLEGPAAVA